MYIDPGKREEGSAEGVSCLVQKAVIDAAVPSDTVMSKKKLNASGCLSVLEISGKAKPCTSGFCPFGHARPHEMFVKGVLSGMGEPSASI